MLRDVLARRKIDATEEFDKQVVLETPTGDLIPIVPDWRGRAFYQDDYCATARSSWWGSVKKESPTCRC